MATSMRLLGRMPQRVVVPTIGRLGSESLGCLATGWSRGMEHGRSSSNLSMVLKTEHRHEANIRTTPQEPVECSLNLPTVVLKFGGSCLGNAEAIQRACLISRGAFQRGQNVCVVVSALYGVTNKLEEACHAAKAGNLDKVSQMRQNLKAFHTDQVDDLLMDNEHLAESVKATIESVLQAYFDPYVAKISHAKAFRQNWFEAVSSLGERLSVALVVAVNNSMGFSAAEVYTDNLIFKDLTSHSGVDMELTRHLLQKKIRPILARGVIPVVSGFIATNPSGGVSTLGRGGTDLTSTLLGAAVDASEVQLWKVESDQECDTGFMKGWKGRQDQRKWTGIRSVDPNAVLNSRLVELLSYEEASELTHFGKKVLHKLTMQPVQQKKIPIYIRNTAIPSQAGTQIGHVQVSGEGEVTVRAVAAIPLPKYNALHSIDASAILDEEMGGLSIISLIGLGVGSQSHLLPSMVQLLEANGIQTVPVPQNVATQLGSSMNNVSVIIPNESIKEAENVLHAKFVLKADSDLESADEEDVEDPFWEAYSSALANSAARRANAFLARQVEASIAVVAKDQSEAGRNVIR